MYEMLLGPEGIERSLNGFVWGPIMLALLVGLGYVMTFWSKGLQFRKLGFVFKRTIGGALKGGSSEKDGNNITPFQAMATALASTIGTGNIVGIATAITVGGPGAIFWMWIAAAGGMMTKYSEITLALKFREKNDMGMYTGGPMYYLRNGLGNRPGWQGGLGKFLAVCFSLFAAVACFGIGNLTQGNSIASSLNDTFGVPVNITGIVLAVVVLVVILGGIKGIAKVTEKLVPFMALFYLIFAALVLILQFDQIPFALQSIFVGAFSPEAVGGGAVGITIGAAIKYGIARGVFANEAGLGSAPMAHAASSTKDPVEQGLWGIFEVFTVSFLICTLTALVILTSQDANGDPMWLSGLNGAPLSLACFNGALPWFNIGSIVITLCIIMFALSTLLGWSYYGETSLGYLFRNTSASVRRAVAIGYRIVYVVVVYVGCIGGLEIIWNVSDTFNGLMAIPNLIGLAFLSSIVIKETKRYFNNVEKGLPTLTGADGDYTEEDIASTAPKA